MSRTSASQFASDILQERKSVKTLKRNLEPWRELLVLIYDILYWTKHWHPIAITLFITVPFLIQLYWNPPFVTSLSSLILVAAVLDYALPLVSNLVSPPQQWTAIKEKKFEQFCEFLDEIKTNLSNAKNFVSNLRAINPFHYLGLICPVLIFTAWIGLQFNNVFIIYLTAIILALSPGILRKVRSRSKNLEAEMNASNFFTAKKNGVKKD